MSPFPRAARRASVPAVASLLVALAAAGSAQAQRYPERLVGTASATHVQTSSSTGSGELLPSAFRFTETLKANVVFKRVKVDGGFTYESTGKKLRWKVAGKRSDGHIAGGGEHITEECVLSGEGVVPIGAYRGNAAGALIRPLRGPLTPGSTYSIASTYGFGGKPKRQNYASRCTSEGTTANGRPGYVPERWLLHAGDREHCSPKRFTFSVRRDGSLAGRHSCRMSDRWELKGSRYTSSAKSAWTWNLKPAGRKRR